MISAEEIGKRIRALRKKKGVSQEEMAAELGMYQADISNLERAMGGSGINDLTKLEAIALYLGTTLTELIGEDKQPHETPGLTAHTVTGLWQSPEREPMVAEIRLTAPAGRDQFYSFIETGTGPVFLRANASLFEQLSAIEYYEELPASLKKYRLLEGEDYVDIFRDAREELLPVIRLLMILGESEEPEELMANARGKKLGEIDIPAPENEPEDLIDLTNADLSAIYRYRLMVETNIEYPSVYTDIDDLGKREQVQLEKLKAACGSEEAYQVWKKDLINAKIKEAKEKDLIVCHYFFAGLDSYDAIIPAAEEPAFKCWIDHNGSAFYTGHRAANDEEIRSYVAQHIIDDMTDVL